MNYVYLLLGSNKGDRMKYLEEAHKKIIQQIGLIIKSSSIYETEPWGFDHECKFLNQCLMVETFLSPHDILDFLKQIELEFGRKRKYRIYESRNLDIDILFYNDIIFNEKDLKIPHPLLHQRKFALVPMVEIAPDLIHPVFKKTMNELILQCSDSKLVVLFQV